MKERNKIFKNEIITIANSISLSDLNSMFLPMSFTQFRQTPWYGTII